MICANQGTFHFIRQMAFCLDKIPFSAIMSIRFVENAVEKRGKPQGKNGRAGEKSVANQGIHLWKTWWKK